MKIIDIESGIIVNGKIYELVHIDDDDYACDKCDLEKECSETGSGCEFFGDCNAHFELACSND